MENDTALLNTPINVSKVDLRQSHPIHPQFLLINLSHQGRPTATGPKSKASTWESFPN